MSSKLVAVDTGDEDRDDERVFELPKGPGKLVERERRRCCGIEVMGRSTNVGWGYKSIVSMTSGTVTSRRSQTVNIGRSGMVLPVLWVSMPR